MTRTMVTRSIDAPLEVVFDTISDIRNFSKAVPEIVGVEFLSERHSGVGTRFRETRLMRGRESATVLEVTEFADDDRIRLIADSHGAIWDSEFTVRQHAGATELTLTMEARPHGLLARILVPFTRGFVEKALEQDMDAVKRWCEEGPR
jgi:hypothetical protein